LAQRHASFFQKKKEIRTSLIELLFRKEKKYINKIIALFVQLEMATADLAFAVILYKLIFSEISRPF